MPAQARESRELDRLSLETALATLVGEVAGLLGARRTSVWLHDRVARVLVPFFTTKEAGHGTGLGLAITEGIVHDHGGTITAATSPRGAAFTIVLPVANDKVASTGT